MFSPETNFSQWGPTPNGVVPKNSLPLPHTFIPEQGGPKNSFRGPPYETNLCAPPPSWGGKKEFPKNVPKIMEKSHDMLTQNPGNKVI